MSCGKSKAVFTLGPPRINQNLQEAVLVRGCAWQALAQSRPCGAVGPTGFATNAPPRGAFLF